MIRLFNISASASNSYILFFKVALQRSIELPQSTPKQPKSLRNTPNHPEWPQYTQTQPNPICPNNVSLILHLFSVIIYFYQLQQHRRILIINHISLHACMFLHNILHCTCIFSKMHGKLYVLTYMYFHVKYACTYVNANNCIPLDTYTTRFKRIC